MAAYHKFLDPALSFTKRTEALVAFVARNVNRHGFGHTSVITDDERVSCFAGYVGEGPDRSAFKDPRTIERV